MKKTHIILVLDAIVLVAGNMFKEKNPRIHSLLRQLRGEIDNIFEESAIHSEPFGDFLYTQKQAIKALLNSPIVFVNDPAIIGLDELPDYNDPEVQARMDNEFK